MADDKKRESEGKTEGGKRKGLPAIVMVAVGAVLGGVGVVFAVPPKTVEVPVAPPEHEFCDVTHPDQIKHEFNPRTKAGKAIASIALKFVYTVRDDREQAAFEQIGKYWDDANSNVLRILKQYSMEQLQAESSIVVLEKELIDDLDRTLFPANGKGEKLAKVSRIVWVRWLMQ